MSNLENEVFFEKLAELQDLICLLESELEIAASQGRFGDGDQIAMELCDAKKELFNLQSYY